MIDTPACCPFSGIVTPHATDQFPDIAFATHFAGAGSAVIMRIMSFGLTKPSANILPLEPHRTTTWQLIGVDS